MSDDLDVFDRTHDSTTTKIRNRKVKVVGAAPTSKDLDSSGGSTDTLQPQQQQPEEDDKDEVVYGRTPDGKIFVVPETHSFIYHLFSPYTRKSHLDILTLVMLGSQCLLFCLIPLRQSRIIFLVLFIIFRLAYNFGLGWILRKQSTKQYIVKEIVKRGWLDEKKQPQIARWCKRELEGKIGTGYVFEEAPVEFTVWLIFRQVVDVILLNDFVSYCWFAWSYCSFPANQSLWMHVLRWVGGWTIIGFYVWVKVDAHRVVKDYAWYWGDAFYMILLKKDLVFDGVYDLAPHPMYSLGYAGFYGLSIIVASYTVLFVSIAAHAAQFGFLLWFENPHIERVYGGPKKPLASRVPLASSQTPLSTPHSEGMDSSTSALDTNDTPGATEGETASETELSDHVDGLPSTFSVPLKANARSSSFLSTSSGINPAGNVRTRSRAKSVSMHDLYHRFFRKDVVVLKNIDLFRASDFSLVLLLTYTLGPMLLPSLSGRPLLIAYFLHALGWRLFHSFGLGVLLQKQSENKWFVRHFIKHYHYPAGEEGAIEEAFANWKVLYNLSLTMMYASFMGLAWKTYSIPTDWTVGNQLLRHVLGISLIALHLWTSVSTYEVLGDFGWLYSDFFLLDNYPAQLAYTGIYRFLNNPERSMGGAAFFGLSIISGSRLVFALAIFSALSHWWFLSAVESPHMRKVYGDAIRKDAGVTRTLKTVVNSNSKLFEAEEVKRVVQEVRGTIEKVDQKITQAVDEFLENARPRFSEVVQDTKFLLQQSRERLVITRVANVSDIDSSKYKIAVLPSAAASAPSASASSSTKESVMRFHIGEPIQVAWEAPQTHSRKDWIGIYRLGACKSQLVTRISSVGKWAPLHDGEFDGEKPIPKAGDGVRPDAGFEIEKGKIVLKGDALPWQTGQYELRLHHDGKHNVMARFAPIEIFVPRPSDPISFDSVHDILTRIITLALDSDPTLVPAIARPSLLPVPTAVPSHLVGEDEPEVESEIDTQSASVQIQSQLVDPAHDPEDFIIMYANQAKRIVSGIQEAFDLDYAAEVVLAEPNVEDLARKIVESRRILGPSKGGGGEGETGGRRGSGVALGSVLS
ncbi:phospholipid methyltransferase-domain-containing protein [Mrakia frigida]|uniref:phosphatidylethanolamine N-methyltransferase n=1 Tax=Mrakia frigida TaxID=29902 RepID=UPI003FCC09CD